MLGATCGGSEENRAISSGAATRSRAAAASAGMCSVWQIWQAVSGPFVWRWRMLPPAAKYSNTAHANTASARRASVRPNMALRRCITLQTSVTPLTLKPPVLMHKLDPYPPALLDPATIFFRHAPAKDRKPFTATGYSGISDSWAFQRLDITCFCCFFRMSTMTACPLERIEPSPLNLGSGPFFSAKAPCLYLATSLHKARLVN